MSGTRQRKYPAERARPVKEADPTTVAKLERDLRTAMRRYNQRRAATDEAAIERDRVIRDAHAAGVTPSRIAEVTGLSVPRIDQIRKGS